MVLAREAVEVSSMALFDLGVVVGLWEPFERGDGKHRGGQRWVERVPQHMLDLVCLCHL